MLFSILVAFVVVPTVIMAVAAGVAGIQVLFLGLLVAAAVVIDLFARRNRMELDCLPPYRHDVRAKER